MLGYNRPMKYAGAFLLFVLITACGIQPVESHKLTNDETNDENFGGKPIKAKQPVLVELFTSEGCKSCPPAERNLAYFQTEQPFEDVELITLALHVDYWNHLGWKDKFSSALYTQRQRVYDRKFRTGSIYTPQMVVDGEQQFVGSNLDKAEKAISKAAKERKALIDILIEKSVMKLTASGIPQRGEDASIYLAIAEDNLKTRVKRGENAGKNLKHVSVVRELKGLGRIEPNQTSYEVEAPFQIKSDWKKENLTATVFIQGNSSRKVYGVQRISLVQKD